MNRHRIAIIALSLVALGCTACGQGETTTPAATPTVASSTVTSTQPESTQPSTAPSVSTSEEGTEGPGGADDLYEATGGAGKGMYWTAGDLRCGITETMTGCQSVAPVKNMPKCNDPKTLAPFIALVASDDDSQCTTQGIFVAETKVPELPVGNTMVHRDSTCKVTALSTVTCTNPLGTIIASPEKFEFTPA